MGFPPLLNLSTRLSTAALPGQTTKMAQTLESMFQNVAYRPTVYRTGTAIKIELTIFHLIGMHKRHFRILWRHTIHRMQNGNGKHNIQSHTLEVWIPSNIHLR